MTDFNPPAPPGFVVHEGCGGMHDCHGCVAHNDFELCGELICDDRTRPDGRWVYFTRVETKGLD